MRNLSSQRSLPRSGGRSVKVPLAPLGDGAGLDRPPQSAVPAGWSWAAHAAAIAIEPAGRPCDRRRLRRPVENRDPQCPDQGSPAPHPTGPTVPEQEIESQLGTIPASKALDENSSEQRAYGPSWISASSQF